MTTLPARAIMLLALASVTAAAPARRGPPPPTGELTLDMADPVIDVRIGDVPLRLRVALDQKRLIELNPDAVERLIAHPPNQNFRFEPGIDAEVGREILKSIEAPAPIKLNRHSMIVTVSSHGRQCCRGVDGEIGIGLLPYAKTRFVRAGAQSSDSPVDFLIDDDTKRGPQAIFAVGEGSIFLQFSLERSETVASGAAGAILANAHNGRLGSGRTIVAAFGIERPVTMLGFPHSISIGGFKYQTIPIRIADYGGRKRFPTNTDDPDEPEDIVVKRRVIPQQGWPVVLIARDRLDACSEITFDAITRTLTLRCAPGDPS